MLKLRCFVLLGFSVIGSVNAKCQLQTNWGSLPASQLLADLATLSSKHMAGRKTGSRGSAKAQQYLISRFAEMGLVPFSEHSDYMQSFFYPKANSNKQAHNIVGWLPGKAFKQRYIVVTAHYDHLGKRGRKIFFGADDNASGVTVMLALARQVAKSGGLAHSMIFVATDAEEKGLYGAKAFIRLWPFAKQTIKANLNLDMLAQGGRRKRLYATHTRKSKALAAVVNQVAEQAPLCLVNGHRKSQHLGFSQPRINWRLASDHGAFLKAGVPFIFLGVGVHNDYHTVQDRYENIDPDFFLAAAETAWQVLQAVDSADLD